MSSSRLAERLRPLRRVVPSSLTGRLVAVAVLLVAAVGLLVSAATAIAMSNHLTGQLDGQLMQSLQRESGNRDDRDFCPTSSTFPGNGFGDRGLPPGLDRGSVTIRNGCAWQVTNDQEIVALRPEQISALNAVPTDGHPHTIDLPELSDYRVIADPDGDTVIGLGKGPTNDAVRSLVLTELGLTAAGVLLAGVAGRQLVRRQLRPLREVAGAAHEVTDQHLASGDTAIAARVPTQHTDPATEVGQVGAALNTLLDHVDDALAARHASEQQVRQFVADASHELRTPLSTIHGYAQLSRRTPDDAGQLSHAMGKVETEAQRMSALVEDMLLLARLDSGRPLANAEVDLTRLLLEAVADARVVAPDHRWRLDLPDEPITVAGDEQRLHQVVTNLLNNARTHTPPGTTVTVSATPTAPVVFTVHDDGPGLPAGLADHAFERFTRGDSSRTRASGGAGLGLSLVAAIVAAHRGTAKVESRPGDTTFTITLPAA